MGAYLTGEPLLPVGTYRDRRSFAQLVWRARRAGTLVRYDKHYCGYSRVASFLDGTCAIWHHPSYYALPDDRDESYERMAARDRADDFSRTGGRDWT